MGPLRTNLISARTVCEPLDLPDVADYLSLRDAEEQAPILETAVRDARATVEASLNRWCGRTDAEAMACLPQMPCRDVSLMLRVRGPVASVSQCRCILEDGTEEDVSASGLGSVITLKAPRGTCQVRVAYTADPLPLDPSLRGILLSAVRRVYAREDVIITDEMKSRLRPFRALAL